MLKSYEAEAGLRLDVFLSKRLEGASRGFVQRLIERGSVRVSGKERPAGYRLRAGEQVALEMPEPAPVLELPILFEDDDLVIVEKPTGLIVHPAGETWLRAPETALTEPEPSVVSWILQTRPPRPGLERCGLVHRLDRETSGVLAVAKSPECQAGLTLQFKERGVEKVYAAVVAGRLKAPEGRIDAPVGRVNRRLVATKYGRPAQSAYKVLKEGKDRSLVEVRPVTGRTHQIRVHLAFIGHPVVGDAEHGGPPADRMYLHAHRLKFEHRGRPLEAVSKVPPKFFEL